MAFDNKELESEVTQLTMRSNGIALDESGRITFLDSGILETIVAGKLPLTSNLALSSKLANDTTNYLCPTNAYQCGKTKMTLA